MDLNHRADPAELEEPDGPESANGPAAAQEALFELLPRLPDPRTLSSARKERERKLLRRRLKDLNAVPRSDWHREFENILQIEVESWNNGTVIEREVFVGEDAPRADFILVRGATLPEHVKSVFHIFRKKNAIEYKRPSEVLTERMIWKAGGYGNLLIGTGQASEYDADELTLSVFAYRKQERQFVDMLERGLVRATETGGIYRVIGMTPLPYQIVITEELEGREYAAFRALSDRTNARDSSFLLDAMKVSSLTSRDRYMSILQTIELHNPGAVRHIIWEEPDMNTVFMDLFEPQIQERERKAAETATAAATAAATESFAERMIQRGMDGLCIADVTGYDRVRIDSIARRLNRTVNWNNA